MRNSILITTHYLMIVVHNRGYKLQITHCILQYLYFTPFTECDTNMCNERERGICEDGYSAMHHTHLSIHMRTESQQYKTD